jgi:hypothetical protein
VVHPAAPADRPGDDVEIEERRSSPGQLGRPGRTKGEPVPRYAALIYDVADQPAPRPEQWQAMMADYGEFGDKAAAEGVFVAAEALEPVSTATTVQVRGGKGGEVTHTDGPFAETKEVLGGFYLLDCADLDEALAWAAQIPGAWHGKVEVRPCIDFGAD